MGEAGDTIELTIRAQPGLAPFTARKAGYKAGYDAAARAALEQADAELFPQRVRGRHRQEIKDAFAARMPQGA